MFLLGLNTKALINLILGAHIFGLFSSIYCRICIFLGHVNEMFLFCYLKEIVATEDHVTYIHKLDSSAKNACK